MKQNSNEYTLSFQQIDRSNLQLAGGKGANLGELSRIDGIYVTPGFCVTTAAFKRVVEENPQVSAMLRDLSLLTIADQAAITQLSTKIRNAIEAIPVPAAISDEITASLHMIGDGTPCAVRSSATAEDLPTASFAGQQDTYLNIIGKEAILRHISRCWASLFTTRAIIYRMQNGFDHRSVHLSVVVQQMVFPQAAGILFTADPVTGNRRVVSIDASFGLGEALVSGRVSADNYKVSDSTIIEKRISTKQLAIYPTAGGGTKEQKISSELQAVQTLTDEQIVKLSFIGRQIEAYFGSPQDIEWCLADDTFYIVQARPITTLFPIPAMPPYLAGAQPAGQETHVFISVGHQQMMTDAIKPLGLSLFQLTTFRPMATAGGRLFVDVTNDLANPLTQSRLLELSKTDPLLRDALLTVVGREDFIKMLPADDTQQAAARNSPLHSPPTVENDPAIATELINASQASIADLKQKIHGRSGVELIDFILSDIPQLKKIIFNPQNMGVIMAGMNAATWLNEKMQEWLGEKNAADTLSLSVPNNVTSEMGLALLDVADVIRPYPDLIEYLRHADDNFLDELGNLKGGMEAAQVISAFLSKYGMRCPGEIDITRTRWAEKPAMLIPLILGNIRNFEPGASSRKFGHGLQLATEKEQDLLHRLRQLPGGEQKASETEQRISILRNFTGYREYPKYGIISRYLVYKQAIMGEAERLLRDGVIRAHDDIYYLTFEELREVIDTGMLDYHLINHRKDEYRAFEKLIPPRVITSDGEIITGAYNREDLPQGAIPGLAVSSGIVEGRARIILNMEEANIEEGDILVTAFTDPSWTPLFVSLKGLVTEVGGLMTHGAVIAREYGLPAVVGVEQATTIIKDGQRIRVNGTDGYVELL